MSQAVQQVNQIASQCFVRKGSRPRQPFISDESHQRVIARRGAITVLRKTATPSRLPKGVQASAILRNFAGRWVTGDIAKGHQELSA
eukprot:8602330-Pyramimonas_sp.AAC.1